jgi:hypothetical protein
MIRTLSILVLVVGFCAGVRCQEQESDTQKELWSGLDVYAPLNEKFRLYFMATANRAEETRGSFETTFGAHVDYNVNKRFVLRAGYRYSFAPGDDDFEEQRIVTEQTFRQDLPWKMLLSDRNRQDWRFINGDFSFRYRNRVRLEREIRAWGRSFTPYGSVEVYYDTRFDVWNRNRLTAGAEFQLKRGFPLLRELTPRKQVILDIYYTKQNDSRSQPNHVHAVGATVALHF